MSRNRQRKHRQNAGREAQQQMGRQQNRSARRESLAPDTDGTRAGDGLGNGRAKAARQTGQQLTRVASAVGKELRSDAKAAQQAATKIGRAAWGTIQENPVPIALTGIGVMCAGAGITWLLMNGAKDGARTDGSSVSGTDGQINGPGRTQRVKQSLKHATEAVGSKASALAHGAVEQGRQLETSLERGVQTHPLAVGAAMLAVGTAIGLAIPRTKLEDGFLGRERDKLVSAAQRTARGAAKKVESLARQIAEPTTAQA
jgi:hypothetical protein